MRDAGNSRQDGFEDRKQIASPSAPAAGFTRTFIKTDGTSWAKQSDDSEAQMGAGGDTWVTVPASSISSGTAGQRAYSSGHIYVAVASNSWKRAALLAFGAANYTYVSDGDANGVLYGIGTLFGAQAWTNPLSANYIVIASTDNSGSDLKASIVDRVVSSYSCNSATPQVVFDLGAARTLVINKYSCRFRNDTSTFCPTAWTLAGSNDGAGYTTVSTVSGLTPAASAWVSTTVSGIETAYRYWKITMTGNNNSGTTHFSIGEFELYGTLTF